MPLKSSINLHRCYVLKEASSEASKYKLQTKCDNMHFRFTLLCTNYIIKKGPSEVSKRSTHSFRYSVLHWLEFEDDKNRETSGAWLNRIEKNAT